MNTVRHSRALKRYYQNVALYVPDPDMPRRDYEVRHAAWAMANWAKLQIILRNEALSLDEGWPDLATFKFPSAPDRPDEDQGSLSVQFRDRKVPVSSDLMTRLLAARIPADDEFRSVCIDVGGQAEQLRSADIDTLLKDVIEALEGELDG